MARNIKLMLETWIIEFLKANYKGEEHSGYELEVASHHQGQHETF